MRGILDSGSQRSFIKEELARLQLKVTGETKLVINTFASEVPSLPRRSKIVEVHVRSQFGDKEQVTEAITIPVICQDVALTNTDCSFGNKLRELKMVLADELTVPMAQAKPGISLLIGSDQIWKIITGEAITSQEIEGLGAINTILGWTLQGPVRKGALCKAHPR